MAENKKSFILYCDVIHSVRKLPNDMAGRLFKHLLAYVNDENPVFKAEDFVLEMTFEPIKQQLKRDLEKYENRRKVNAMNGSKGGQKSKKKQPLTNQADNDNGNGNENENDLSKLDIRKAEFGKLLKSYKELYPDSMRGEFFAYWTEHGPKDKKMRFEKQTSFDVKRRLVTWKNNQNGNKKDTRNGSGTNSSRQNFD